MFVNQSVLLLNNPASFRCGIAVSDVDGDGNLELFVTGVGSANQVLQWDGSGFVDIIDRLLAAPLEQTIGVAAADLDGDGREELYVLNIPSPAGSAQRDCLWDWQVDRWVDLFSLPQNQGLFSPSPGQALAAIDRWGTGRYGFLVASDETALKLYEMRSDGRLTNAASEGELALGLGGRGLVTLPLVSNYMDIFMVSDKGPNTLFRNQGNGTFEEMALQAGLSDPHGRGRGVAALDADRNGRFDLIYGNWEGPHRLFLQISPGKFQDVAPTELMNYSKVRNVITADFNNDGYEEVFFNNFGEPNALFGLRDQELISLDIGEAQEPDGWGTGVAIGDFNGDGFLELLIAHGEIAAQPLSLYQVPPNPNHWIRVMPLTAQGAPARGAIVTLVTEERIQRRAINAGSGYLCQMEPVAHFGLGSQTHITRIEVRWLDGTQVKIEAPAIDQLIRVPHP